MERRSFPRLPVQLHTEIEITVNSLSMRHNNASPATSVIHCMVNSIDISLGGFSVKILHSPLDTGMSFSPALAYALVGKEISASFTDHDISVTGKVVRIDPKTMLMAVIITWVSDIGKWRGVCDWAITGCCQP